MGGGRKEDVGGLHGDPLPPMNILFISSIQMWGGGEVWLMDMMRELKQRGHSVSLICRPGTELAGRAKDKGFDVVTMRIGGDFDPLVIWNARGVMKEKKIDVICTNMDKDLRFGGIAAKLAGVRGIVPSREIDYPLKNRLRYRMAYNYLATTIVVNSFATRRTVTLSAPWLDENRLRVIYKGIDFTPYQRIPASSIRKEFDIDRDAPIVAFVGQLDERKGIVHLLQAWRLVHESYPAAVLLMAGTGPMKSWIEHFTTEHALSGSVILAGFRDDIPSVLLQCSMLVLPSLWEGFGYVLVEAMAAGLPTVATATSSIPEIVEDGRTGILVEPKNSLSLSAAIGRLLGDPALQKNYGEAGRKAAQERFSIDRMITEFEEVFRHAAGTHD